MSPAVCLLLGKCHIRKIRKERELLPLRPAEECVRINDHLTKKREKQKLLFLVGGKSYNQKLAFTKPSHSNRGEENILQMCSAGFNWWSDRLYAHLFIPFLMPNLRRVGINSILISWEKCWMKEQRNRKMKLQTSALTDPERDQWIPPQKGLWNPPPSSVLWQRSKKFHAGKRKLLGCWGSSVSGRPHDLPLLSKFYPNSP